VVRHAGARGNQTPDDDVLLPAAQQVALADVWRLDRDVAGLLEGGRDDELVFRK